ncbi:MAG: hypothetical protein H7Y38_15100 [Armatimonadetes bacterium]|nr:hypothetical protein [Armatimonadota bacterium]
MSLETITRDEFDRRLDAANDRAEAELHLLEQENRMLQQLIERYQSVQAAQANPVSAPSATPRTTELRRLLLQLAGSSLEAAQAL